MPRQRYGIDFYGHEQGEILIAVDLCTREATLWFLTNRKQDSVVRALLSGLIFQKGVPLSFRNDEAPEFVKGAVAAMNRDTLGSNKSPLDHTIQDPTQWWNDSCSISMDVSLNVMMRNTKT